MLDRRTLQGWISLPIIFFLLLVAGLSVEYQQRLQDGFQWQAKLGESNQNRVLWQTFQQEIVMSPAFALAQKSHCLGFCQLVSNSLPVSAIVWRHGEEKITYLWHYYLNSQDVRFYRLCASQNHQQYHCWWWQEHRLISQGLMSAAD